MFKKINPKSSKQPNQTEQKTLKFFPMKKNISFVKNQFKSDFHLQKTLEFSNKKEKKKMENATFPNNREIPSFRQMPSLDDRIRFPSPLDLGANPSLPKITPTAPGKARRPSLSQLFPNPKTQEKATNREKKNEIPTLFKNCLTIQVKKEAERIIKNQIMSKVVEKLEAVDLTKAIQQEKNLRFHMTVNRSRQRDRDSSFFRKMVRFYDDGINKKFKLLESFESQKEELERQIRAVKRKKELELGRLDRRWLEKRGFMVQPDGCFKPKEVRGKGTETRVSKKSALRPLIKVKDSEKGLGKGPLFIGGEMQGQWRKNGLVGPRTLNVFSKSRN